MRKDLLDEIIQLKEEKKILEAACGVSNVDRHVFSREEKEHMKALRDTNRSCAMLEDIERRIQEDEEALRKLE